MSSGGKDKEDPPARIEPNSPFYIGSQDRPGDFITPVRLKLNNYDDWAHAIRVSLRARRKFGFLDGSIKSPTPPCTKDDWVTVQNMLVSWLMNTIEDEVKSLLPRYENAKKLWDDLLAQFSVVDGPRIQQLKADIHNCTQTASMSVAVYYGKLNMLWGELDKYEPILSCGCDMCECDLGTKHAARRDSDRVHQFLFGLNGTLYGTIRSYLLQQTPLPPLLRVFQAVSQEERVHGMSRSQDRAVEVTGFAVRPTFRSAPRGTPYLSKAEKRSLICTHCKKQGHDVTMCFDLLPEKPDWWYELKGTKPPPKMGSGRGSSRGSAPTTARANVVDVQRDEGNAAGVTVYSTPSHTFAGPTFESGDWHG